MSLTRQEAEASTSLTPAGGAFDYGEDARDSGLDRRDVAVPFLRVLQANSPQLARGNSKYIASARPGDFFNTVTGDHFDGEKGVFIVPIAYKRSYTEWRPRDSGGGGLVADYGSDDSIMRKTQPDERRRPVLPNGNYIVEAAQYYAYHLIDEETSRYTQVILNFVSTQWRKARAWNGVMSGLTTTRRGKIESVPFWAVVYKITTIPESNEAGDWMGYKIERHKWIEDVPGGADIYRSARDFKQMVKEDRVSAQHEGEETVARGEHMKQDDAPKRAAMDDEIPF